MDEPSRNLEQEIQQLLKRCQAGEIEFDTCVTKVARRVLEQDGCDEMMHTLIAAMLSEDGTRSLGCVLHLLSLRILRLEDDVRVLRGELLRDRVEQTKKNGGRQDGQPM